jgi:hypothetical protein
MPEQFPYPEQGWSTGKMRMARRALPSDPGYPIRELEGERKRRETKVSQFGGVEGTFADSPVLETMEQIHKGRKEIPGLITPGNIDLTKRPQVPYEGKTATVRSISVEQDGKHILIPTVIGNKVVSDDEAYAHYQKTGEHLGIFESSQDADSYGRALSKEQGKYYGAT